MDTPTPEALMVRIARLEGRIAALENALDRRSRELRVLQATLCPADLVQLSRLADGLAPLPRLAHQLEYWTESTVIAPADLESTLVDLWASLTPSGGIAGVAPRVPLDPWREAASCGPAGPDPADRGAESSR